jgi:hypothetical protein
MILQEHPILLLQEELKQHNKQKHESNQWVN